MMCIYIHHFVNNALAKHNYAAYVSGCPKTLVEGDNKNEVIKKLKDRIIEMDYPIYWQNLPIKDIWD